MNTLMTNTADIVPELRNRLKKRFTHLKKWAKREQITCFRIYERDLIDYPLIVDWYDGEAVAWIYVRKKDETPDQQYQFEHHVTASILDALDISIEHLYVKYRGRQKGLSTQYEKLNHHRHTKVIKEHGISFEVNLSDYLDTGLFLDHRPTRVLCKAMCKDKKVLNLFAYTGSFTCYAIEGGAKSTTTVDLSAKYIEWCKRNMAHNRYPVRSSDRFIVDNCLEFIKIEGSRNRYDVIICDPPTFSNSKKMRNAFSIDEDYVELIERCVKLLAPKGRLIFSTNSRSFKLDEDELPDGLTITNMTKKTVPEDFKNARIHQCWMLALD